MNQQTDLLKYQNELLSIAGLPENCIEYLLDRSSKHLAAISEGRISEEKKLLEKSVVILIFKLAENQLSIGNVEDASLIKKVKNIQSDGLPPQRLLFIFQHEGVFDMITIENIRHFLFL